MPTTPYLYILVRKDLNSLNAGKAVAHGAHAASQFTYKTMKRIMAGYTDNEFERWVTSADGFGTKITLHVTKRELETAVTVAQSMAFTAQATIDPTYPYILDAEYARLIDHKVQVSEETLASGDINPDNAPTPIGNGKMLCLREEMTAGYIFGDKASLKPIVGNFPMMP